MKRNLIFYQAISTISVGNARNWFFCGKTSVQKIRSNKILLRVFISFVVGNIRNVFQAQIMEI